MKPLKLLLLLCAIAALGAGATAAFGNTAHAAAAATVVKTKSSTKYGTILVTSAGKTLYLDAGDKPPHFACTGGCLSAWPPLATAGKPKAGGAVKASMLGTVKNGKVTQVTYDGHPLYTFTSDSSSNPISGEGVNGFYVVSPSGARITHAVSATSTTSSTSSSGGQYGY